MEEILKVTDLNKSFKLSAKQQKIQQTKIKVVHAVDNLSFSAYKGEIFALLGPNGAGKTTTLRILSTLIRPDSGDAFINGASIITNPTAARSRIGFLTSELKLEEFFTPDYLFDYFSKLHNVGGDMCAQRKKELFEKFGIDKFSAVKVANLSTGMKQKVSLAISIVHDPEIIIFDEPTNGLDVLTERIVTDFLFELKQQRKTIILSTHIFSLVEKLCDRVGIIIDGKMAVCDTLEAVKGSQSLEDAFFKIYYETAGENV